MVSIGTLGVTILLDMYNCSDNHLDTEKELTKLLKATAKAANATILNLHVHKFSPQGLTGVAAISESHIAIHTWPARKFASVDIYTCGDHAAPHNAKEFLLKVLRPEKHNITEITRGGVCWEKLND